MGVRKIESVRIKQILTACKSLGMPAKDGPKDSLTVQMLSFDEFKKRLPPDKDCSVECRLFRKTKKALEILVDGNGERSCTFYRVRKWAGIDWVLHPTGPPPRKTGQQTEDEIALNDPHTTRRDQTTAIRRAKGWKRARGRA